MSVMAHRIDPFTGSLLVAGDAGWDEARQAFNLTIDQRPELIALPADAADTAAAVRYARDIGLRVAPQRTGHNAEPLGSLAGTMLLRTDRMRGVEIDVEARRARVQAGAKWGDVVPLASEHGLAALHGSTPDVSVVGYTLGGGMGWYARKLGLAANSVTAIELVTADGEGVRATRDHEPDLFWALRGGGGDFGVVTAMEFELFPMPEVYAGVLFFPFEQASEVLHAWRDLADRVPDEMVTVGRLMQFPPIEEVPEQFRGKSFALVEVIHQGSQAEGEELLRPLRELGPELDTCATVPPVEISELHMDPPDPVPYSDVSQLLGELPPELIDRVVELAGPGSGSPLLSVEFRQTGGALARSAPGHGALDTLPGSFGMFAVGMVTGPESAEAVAASLGELREALAPDEVGLYLNFVEQPTEISRFFDEETCRRLADVKRRYDPDGLIRGNHPVTAG